MTQKAETLLWKSLQAKLPKNWHTTRIENRFGGGIPDVHICADGLPFWIELKVTKTNRVNVSAHQVAWNFAYCKSGGVSFFLVKALEESNLYLFDGSRGRELAEHGLKSGRVGDHELGSVGSGPCTVVPCLCSGAGRDQVGLQNKILEILESRVRKNKPPVVCHWARPPGVGGQVHPAPGGAIKCQQPAPY